MATGSDLPARSSNITETRHSVEVATAQPSTIQELDDFGLPLRPASRLQRPVSDDSSDDDDAAFHDAEDSKSTEPTTTQKKSDTTEDSQIARPPTPNGLEVIEQSAAKIPDATKDTLSRPEVDQKPTEVSTDLKKLEKDGAASAENADPDTASRAAPPEIEPKQQAPVQEPSSPSQSRDFPSIRKEKRASGAAVSEWSHQRLAASKEEESDEEEVEWQAMPALGQMDWYDDRGRLVAKATKEDEPTKAGYGAIGAASKGYTKVQLDEDAMSATSMDDDTNYLFKKDAKLKELDDLDPDDDDDYDEDLERDAASQLENTKDLLTEGQRIAYVGVVRLTILKMLRALEAVEKTRGTKKEIAQACENMEIWGQQMMVRLFAHMEIDSAEQVMIEQLGEHGVTPDDLSPPLMQNARLKSSKEDESTADVADTEKITPSPPPPYEKENGTAELEEVQDGEDVPVMQSDLHITEDTKVDLRWTVLCDLFLLLIASGVYDSRSRRLLERVASTMQVTWQQICRFERRIIEMIEMQEAEIREDLDESENLEKRRKAGLKRKYVTMGLVTVGGAAVIGLSAGLLAPVIGAGLAAGFGTIGIGGTTAFLTGVGGAAIVTSIGVTTGGTIALRATDRRMGHVKTFEYRPLHNNKRMNLILTVSGWMTGKVDDVRLPFSTVDPIMGDIYSLLWEPDMLRSTGETINILATEALTQSIQQVLGMTILTGLMSAIQLPIVLTKLAYLIDNPWNVSLDRANAAGLILADSLIQRHLGQRPITLVGFSLGARLIFSCLRELSNRGAYGIVQNVYLFGAPVTAKKDDYLRARTVIAGRFVNGYASNDWILGYLFRATSGGLGRVAGLAPVENVPGLENKNVGEFVNGHMAYRAAMPRLLREVGWEVESDEFTEIEDPDPENHEKRQRELIQEIDDARKKAEAAPEKKRFGLFKRGKLAEKRDWEFYGAGDQGNKQTQSNIHSAAANGQESNVLFDVDAIRRELASEFVEVRELDSTMPVMQIVTTGKDGKEQTEYLRLPPGVNLTSDEMSRMKLPPRPDDDDKATTAIPVLPARTSSLRPSPKQSPGQSPMHSPQPSVHSVGKGTAPTPEPNDYGWDQPKELVSTLPPLKLTPTPSQHSFDMAPPSRPPLKAHATEPTGAAAWDKGPSKDLTSPVDSYPLEHNAWADEDDFGKSKGVQMTFE
jgi:hypothetical protein